MSEPDALDAFYAALVDDDPVQLYERAPCGYLSTTPDGTIVKVNQTFLTWTGYDRQDLVGRRTFSELLTTGGRIYHETHYAPMLRMQGSAREIALEIVKRDGRRLPVLANSVVEQDEHGRPLVIRTAVFDATDRREYERELLRAKERAEDSERRARELSRILQQTLIPPAPPSIAGLEVSAAYRPAGAGDEVGGDFYDIFEVGSGGGDWVVAIGDVRGKGAEAAVVTALARYTIRAGAVRHPDPREVLSQLNTVILRDGTDRFCTVAVARLHFDRTWTITSASGGHPLPLVSRRNGDIERLGRPGTLVGVFDDPEFVAASTPLDPGDVVVLYTDGVTEARAPGGRFFEDTGLEGSLSRHRDAADVSTAIVSDVLAFQGGNAKDDIAIVTLRVPSPA